MTSFYFLESRGDVYVVGCDLCEWWDENDSSSEAVEAGERHVEQCHPLEHREGGQQ